MFTLSWIVIAICTGAGLLGGFIDAIAGGGGLITLPALLLTGVPPHYALGVNKCSACLGTATALGNFARRGLVLWRLAFAGLAFSLLGSWLGALLTLHISNEILGKILVMLLPVGMCATLLPPRRQAASTAVAQGWRLHFLAPLVCLGIGLYDGFFGPGTGSFLILAFHWILRVGLLEASATAKVLNLASNVGSLVTFAWNGCVLWSLALPMAAGCMAGNWLGSRLAIRTGAKAVRRFLMISLGLLLLTLIWRHFVVPDV